MLSEVIIYSILSVLIVSLISLIGIITFQIKTKNLKKILIYLISFSAGALLGNVFFHLLPHIIEENGFSMTISISVILGIIISFILEKFIHWRHCHIPITKNHIHPFSIMSLVGDSLHNFIDGIVIAASYLISIPIGIATTIAVIFHEVPQEIADFGVLIHGGFTKTKALLMNFLVSLFAFLGLLITLYIGVRVEGILDIIIPIAAGNFIYIAAADFIPELHKETNVKKSLLQLGFFILGVLMILSIAH